MKKILTLLIVAVMIAAYISPVGAYDIYTNQKIGDVGPHAPGVIYPGSDSLKVLQDKTSVLGLEGVDSWDSVRTAIPDPAGSGQSPTGITAGGFRGMWVATVLNLDYPSKPGISVDSLKKEAVSILDDCVDMGFNAVVLQVRPSGDAIYKSDIFPYSAYLTGNQGQAPEGGFDPLEFWITEAHSRGLELHAWINPYRITRGSESAPKTDPLQLAATNPARQHPDWTVAYKKDGSLYYNPGIPEARQLIVSGVSEIVRGYNVDGIHFDDYFYPGTDFDDADTFSKYGKSYDNIGDWRRDNINALIRETQESIKNIKSSVRFGVSPFAIWANKASLAQGSDTNGNQSYFAMYADTRKWVLSGWVDYICPQIYWQIGHATADYEKVLKWWADTVRGTNVDLYVGHASYRSGESSSPSNPWYGTNELERQLRMNDTVPEVKGSLHFRYSFFKSYPPLRTFIKKVYNPSSADAGDDATVTPVPVYTLSTGRPFKDDSTTFDKIYVLGSSDPKKPLYLNGDPVENRSEQGFFGVLVNLSKGENVLTFTQEGSTLERRITRKTTSGAEPTKLSKAEIVADSAYPNLYDEYLMPGEKLTLSCVAPIGSTVTCKLGGGTYTLTPGTKTAPSSGIYGTTFTYGYTLPVTSEKGKILTVGTPEYTMSYNGKIYTVKSSGDVKCITSGAPYYATVKSATAFLYAQNGTSGGPVGELSRGMVDYITAVRNEGKWVRLGLGAWILRTDVERETGDKALGAKISAPKYENGDKWDVFSVSLSTGTSSKAELKDKSLVYTVYNAASDQTPILPSGSLFSSVTAVKSGSNVTYTFNIASGQTVNGYYTQLSGGVLELYIKRKPRAAAVGLPLKGISVMVDPGHGGTAPGAYGPLGMTKCEKYNTLELSLKLKQELESLGATVLMTRTTDVDISLEDRLEMNRSARPDLFISIHNNSMELNVDCTNIKGISTWYKEAPSKDFSAFLFSHLKSDLGRPDKGDHQQNLYVCRSTWNPSVLIECGFISNPSEFEWLISEKSQTTLARSIADGVLAYFS